MDRVEIALMSGLGEHRDVEEVILRFSNGRRFSLRSDGFLQEDIEPNGWKVLREVK